MNTEELEMIDDRIEMLLFHHDILCHFEPGDTVAIVPAKYIISTRGRRAKERDPDLRDF